MKTIEFPGLGIELTIDRIAIPLPTPSGGIYWYALIIAAGMILALWYVMYQEKKRGGRAEDFLDLLLVALPIAILGARLYYVLFDFESFRDNLWDIFKVWEGGLAIYGGIIASVLVAIFFCRRRKLKLWHVMDMGSMGLFIGQAVGRWGNFVNMEVYGKACTLPWRMKLPSRPYAVHPLFLYESVWNILGFLILHLLNKKKPFEGFGFSFYLVWYGIGRFIIEGMRDTKYILYAIPNVLMVSQLVSVLAILAGVITGIFLFCQNKRKNRV